MARILNLFIIVIILFLFNSCSKEQDVVNVLLKDYDLVIKDAESTGEDFVVNLHARALQPGERGEWRIVQGTVIDGYVELKDKTNPFSKFKGMPGEEYTLEWKRWTKAGDAATAEHKVKIPDLSIEIVDQTPSKFSTIRVLFVDPKYRGTWSIKGSYGQITSKYHDGYAEPPEKKPSIELHGYANTTYVASFKVVYGGKTFEFKKEIRTGDYTEDEGLYELQLSRGSYRALENRDGNIIELNLQSSGIAWILGKPSTYPALSSFKKLRKLVLGGSSLDQIPTIAGDHYVNLEELSMDRMGTTPVFPANFGNLTKLKTLIFTPLYSVSSQNQVLLPKSFGNLKALENFTLRSAGYVNFNGTLGQLTNLKTLSTEVASLPDDIGELKHLHYLSVDSRSNYISERLSECTSLVNVFLTFTPSAAGEITLSSKIGDLKKLENLSLISARLRNLPESFSELSALKTLRIESQTLQSLPVNFGNLASLETLTVYGVFTSIPASFGKLSRLSTLSLGGKCETLPDSFGDLSSLSYFNAESTVLKTLPSTIGKLKSLKEIKLRGTKVDSLPKSFSDLDALEKLDLSYSQLKSFPGVIIPLKSISSVSLHGTLSGDIPRSISTMKTGVIFYMNGVTNLTAEHMKFIVSICKGKVFFTDFGYFSS